MSAQPVTARLESVVYPTYVVGAPERNPVFFEKRVYQGSSGKVYPVPFIDRLSDEATPVSYQAAHLENEYVRLMMLPEIGGRVHLGQDKTSGDYDFFYRQDAIKPALVGLAGPWVSGGVEFNWPQHHRPDTFMPADVFIEEESDGARTVWLSAHDPLLRLKGMHGLRLRPQSALIELRVRLYNRTPLTQTFLWWANAAARVHEEYQSFFPVDVHHVADHAVRAQSTFPIAQGAYYGVRYQDRPGANDLTWYRNIPVPTSYMVRETAFNFLGGFDHSAQAGFLQVANRHIAPGKKQWTWGNHAFGYAWDRELTDGGGPYIELMGGVYTDNQPDFSYLAPYETKTFSQYWWPIQQTGPVQAASERAALRLVVTDNREIDLGVLVPTPIAGARILLTAGHRARLDVRVDLAPGQPFVRRGLLFGDDSADSLALRLLDAHGATVLSYRPPPGNAIRPARPLATEPPPPAAATSTDELYFIGEHLEQYRHATRSPVDYWREALARDPGDARCHIALGRWRLRRAEFAAATGHFEKAIARLTSRHPNPVTGEAHYYFGLAWRWQERAEEAYAAFYKATWNYEWRAAAYCELAALDCRRGDFAIALEHVEASLDTNRQNNKAHVLKAAALRRLDRLPEAAEVVRRLLAADPLDHWARHEQALQTGRFERQLELSRNDAQTALDLAFDYADGGFYPEAIGLLERHLAHPLTPAAVPNPLARTQSTRYTLAWLKARAGFAEEAIAAELAAARAQSSDYFFPSRLHEIVVLEWSLAQPRPDPLAHFALGNLCYHLERHEEAMAHWAQSVSAGAAYPTVQRNRGLAFWNVQRDGPQARASYERALALDSRDARLVYEFDQLRKKLNEPLEHRLAFLEQHRALVLQRDDAAVELAALYNLLNRPADALALLASRRFHPWEGGEGAVLRQYTAAHLRLGQRALAAGDGPVACEHFGCALQTPENLGEAYHLLQPKAEVNYWLGRGWRASGREADAVRHFELSAAETSDFGEMAVPAHTALSYYRGLSLRELGRETDAAALFHELRQFGLAGIGRPARIDYFATSLPNMLVFSEDLQARRDAEHHLLAALGAHGLGDAAGARGHLAAALDFSNADLQAVALARALGESANPDRHEHAST